MHHLNFLSICLFKTYATLWGSIFLIPSLQMRKLRLQGSSNLPGVPQIASGRTGTPEWNLLTSTCNPCHTAACCLVVTSPPVLDPVTWKAQGLPHLPRNDFHMHKKPKGPLPSFQGKAPFLISISMSRIIFLRLARHEPHISWNVSIPLTPTTSTGTSPGTNYLLGWCLAQCQHKHIYPIFQNEQYLLNNPEWLIWNY